MHASTADATHSATIERPRLRIGGLDVARAIAVLGMVGSHTGDEGIRGDESDGWAWLTVTHGYPSALFAVLAGISMTLMVTTRGTVPVSAVTADHLSHTRVRIAVRAAILIALGVLLAGFGTPVIVILMNLGVMFLLSLPMLRWRTGALLGIAAVCALGGGWLARMAAQWSADAGLGEWPPLHSLWSGHYPALAWMAYVMMGLAVGRMDLRSTSAAVRLVAVGAAIAAGTRVTGWVLRERLSDVSATTREHWLIDEAHSYTPIEMVENSGVALAVIGLSLLAASRWPRALWPLIASGSMALTLYVAHLIVIASVGVEMVWQPSNVSFVVLAASLVAFACGWRAIAGQGPLERMLTSASTAAAARWR
ncbi:heparan-alpha-glucosaminide N-acetyltransferase domain-containing protein [Demequina muriae]|uniref:Heparan-alpha-glucosaminide N-acetyltransferase domain-containing protein n=1 Tax=Demequina muriae TaxID=3051664 RepID=A0ABT8GK29_9MICO|nr:heparan-alpha-glucosaminide N-acetyltransferase domain-containing protein [Demequina sp. EGI L300058]MDN4481291.1 heparan-alpha-glucosaminide N-acetyltransferase domain-containing protein [Demequina sp. EGI L300058]